MPSGLDLSNSHGGFGMDDAADHFGKLRDRQVFAGPHVDMRRLIVVTHQEHACVRQIVDVQELAPHRTAAPDDNLSVAPLAGLVKLPDESRQHVGAGEIEVVMDAVKVRRHRRDEVAAVLRPVVLTELDARDLGDRIRLVGRLELARQEILLLDRLRASARIDARAPQVQQLLRASYRWAECTTVA